MNITVENGRIRVTVSQEIAAKFTPHPAFTGGQTVEQALRGRLLSTAMTKLASAAELQLIEGEMISAESVREVAHNILMREYLGEHGHYNADETMMRYERGLRMSQGMENDVALAAAYARGVLQPISMDDARLYVESKVLNNDLSSRECATLEKTVSLLLNRLGVDATAAMDKALKSLQTQAEIERHYYQCRANIDGWEIEVIGDLPAYVGLSRLAPEVK